MNDNSVTESCENNLSDKVLEENGQGTPNNATKTPRKKGRVSLAVKATEEGKALLKEMGFDDSDTPGRRRTRAATRGEVYTPPPPKRERRTPGTGSSRRGRRSKNEEVGTEDNETSENAENKDSSSGENADTTDKDEKSSEVEMTEVKDRNDEKEEADDKKISESAGVSEDKNDSPSKVAEDSKSLPLKLSTPTKADSPAPKVATFIPAEEKSASEKAASPFKKDAPSTPLKGIPDASTTPITQSPTKDTPSKTTINANGDTAKPSAPISTDARVAPESSPKSTAPSGPLMAPIPASLPSIKTNSEIVSQSMDGHTNSRPGGVETTALE